MKNQPSRLSAASCQRHGARVSSQNLVDAPVGRPESASAIARGASSVLACPVCFRAEESSMIDATRLGIMVMLGILFAVQGGFVAFFLYLRRRAKHIADVDFDTEWSELQRGSRTS
jgi:hypothetical protein